MFGIHYCLPSGLGFTGSGETSAASTHRHRGTTSTAGLAPDGGSLLPGGRGRTFQAGMAEL